MGHWKPRLTFLNIDSDSLQKNALLITYKLSDTYTFGYEQALRDIQGNRVTVRLKKHDVIPIIIVPYAGKKNVEAGQGKEMRKVDFTEHVLVRGGVVLFTGEFEQYLQTKLGRHVDLMRTFKAWRSQKKTDKPDCAHEQEFTKLLLDYLFEQGSKRVIQPVETRCT